jgi:hypothetical protein
LQATYGRLSSSFVSNFIGCRELYPPVDGSLYRLTHRRIDAGNTLGQFGDGGLATSSRSFRQAVKPLDLPTNIFPGSTSTQREIHMNGFADTPTSAANNRRIGGNPMQQFRNCGIAENSVDVFLSDHRVHRRSSEISGSAFPLQTN